MDLFCKLFVDAECDKNELVSRLAEITNGAAEHSSVVTKWCEFNVVRNSDSDERRTNSEQGGFLYFPFFLEIEPSDGVEHGVYVTGIGSLLTNLWNSGIQAVAACDFEDELPLKGGYNPTR
jgi:hypothetical protein